MPSHLQPNACCAGGSCALGTSSVCQQNRQGVLCGSCIPGTSMWSDTCVPCNSSFNPAFLASIIISGFVLNVLFLFYLKNKDYTNDNGLFRVLTDYIQTSLLLIYTPGRDSFSDLLNLSYLRIDAVSGNTQCWAVRERHLFEELYFEFFAFLIHVID